MIFASGLCDRVLDGSKTQTRRLIKPGEVARIHPRRVVDLNGRTKWQVGRTYAVQPGRGKRAVGRIRITRIRTERLQDIRPEDVVAEGFGRWRGMHQAANMTELSMMWDRLHTQPGTRWDDNPLVWVLEFELVERG